MKQFLYLTYSVLLLLCAACTEADIVSPEPGGADTGEGEPLSVKNLGMWMEVESRSIATGGPGQTDKNPNPLKAVGVSVTKTSGSGTVSFYTNSIKSQQFVYNVGKTPVAGWELAEGEEQLLLYTEKGTVYGYAPADKSISLTGTPRVPSMSGVKVSDKQNFIFNDGGNPVVAATDVQWETDQEDYLYCTVAEPVDRWSSEASLEMQHALAKVSFRVLEEGSAFAGCYVKKVVLKSTGGFKKSTSAKLNLATGGLEGTLTAVDELVFTAGGDLRAVGSVAAGAAGDAAATVPVQAFGLVIPVSGVNVTLELTFDDGRIFTMKPAVGGNGPGTFTGNWQKGYNYLYNLRMQPQGIELTDVKVAAWNDGGAYDVPME